MPESFYFSYTDTFHVGILKVNVSATVHDNMYFITVTVKCIVCLIFY
jgi:hypothetical protein